MLATEMTLDDVFSVAKRNKALATTLSFIQVEFGLDELRGHWEGFAQSNDFYDFHFSSKRDCAIEFGTLLSEFDPQPVS